MSKKEIFGTYPYYKRFKDIKQISDRTYEINIPEFKGRIDIEHTSSYGDIIRSDRLEGEQKKTFDKIMIKEFSMFKDWGLNSKQ